MRTSRPNAPSQNHPQHSILGEEELAADTSAEHLWIIDPLDGTTNFVHDIPHFAVSVAYYRNGTAECGVICNPVRDDWYTAVQGNGAFHNGRAINVSHATEFNEVLISVGFYYDRGAIMEATLAAMRECYHKNVRGIRRLGTASLDLDQVATGQFGAYFEYELSLWDFTAGKLLVEEARGRVTTCRGDALPLNKSSVLAGNPQLHELIRDITARHYPG